VQAVRRVDCDLAVVHLPEHTVHFTEAPDLVLLYIRTGKSYMMLRIQHQFSPLCDYPSGVASSQ
jgi:hypothetical protein